MGFLGVHFEVVGGGKITLCLKPIRIVLETSNLTRKYTPIFSFRKYNCLCLGLLNFADVIIFLQKIAFFVQKSAFTKSNSVKAVLEIFY